MRLGDDRHPRSGEPGNLIGVQVGAFTIVCPLGEGDRGSMYLAEHPVLNTRRAVRVLPPHVAHDPRAVQRFVEAARAAARVQHRNLAQVHDVGPLAGGAWFMVLDHIDGGTLDRRIASHAGPMALDPIAHIVGEIAGGLQAAHDHGIVCGGLTPEQVGLILHDGDRRWVVRLDLGIAAPGPGPDDEDPFGHGPARAYRSPEQLRGAPPGAVADVFALGAIAYRMTTGGWFPHPYGDACTGPPVDPRERVPELPAAWAEAIVAALAADPSQRPASPRAFALGLAGAAELAIARRCTREPIHAAPGADLAAPGAELGARYRLGERLGGGGMAEVFAATMTGAEGFTRPVAIKRVLPELSRVPSFAAMFVAEAQIASRLTHPNIVSVLDFARDAEGRLSLVMEYVDGKDLASLLATGPIAPALASFLVLEVLRGLGYAHDLPEPGACADLAVGRRDAPGAPGAGTGRVLGVVHRDVSPQNVLLSYEGAVKLSDFGLAKVRAASGVVRSDVVRGKPSYMSPEQIAGDPLDGRTDLYAAGVMLWEMLADRPLFAGTPREITAQQLFRDVARPSSFRADVPLDLEAVAMTMLARDRNERYPTARAAIDALLGCADVPRDGGGELADLLIARFPEAAGARSARCSRARSDCGGGAGSPRGRRGEPITVAAPPSGSLAARPPSGAARAGRPRRRVSPATLGLVVLVGLAVGVLARGDIASPRPPAPAAPAAPAGAAAGAPGSVRAPDQAWSPAPPAPPAPPASREPAAPASREPAAPTSREPAASGEPRRLVLRPSDAAMPRPPHRERTERPAPAGRTGELAIIVRPWAMIWLNGKPSGQTPFRAAVPAGRYRIRLANDDTGHDEVTTVTVEADRSATVERSW
jgi:serine/threonine protein kinase